MALTGKKRVFADAVLAGKTNKDAAIEAGYSAKTASAAGSRLVKDSEVAAYIEKRRAAVQTGEPVKEDRPTFDLGAALIHRDPRDFLLAAMNDMELEPRQRLEAAKALMPFFHKRLGEGGKKEEREEGAKKAAAGRFAAGKPPLKVVGGHG